jgi:thioredoxin reductase (NADPH)
MDKPDYEELQKPMEPSEVPDAPSIARSREVIVVGAGLAGLSAAIYLARALRDVLVIDAGESLAIWEPEIQNYLGFPNAISGKELLRRGREQAQRYGAEFVHEEVESIWRKEERFFIKGKKSQFDSRKLLLGTGVYHLPPKIPAVNECVGKSIFFCKDCDGYRVQGQRVIIAGHNNEAVEYALGILVFTECVMLLTNGEAPTWDAQHQEWLSEYKIPVYTEKIRRVSHDSGQISALELADGVKLLARSIFTTRGDVFNNSLARQLGAEVDVEGQIIVDRCQRTNVRGLFAAGCVTPANCQMIIAAGDGAAAAQAINRELFEEYLRGGELLKHRHQQMRQGRTEPVLLPVT